MSGAGQPEATALVLVTGHTFGVRAFEGIFSSRAFLDGRLEVPLTIGLDAGHAGATVGYQSPEHLAAEQGVPHVSTTDGRLTSLADRIRAVRPAYILVIGWSQLISGEVLSIPAEVAGPQPAAGSGAPGPGAGGVRFGCIGMHPTSLPEGRGQAPIPWTIIKGYQKTALSVFFLRAAADTGPIIAQYDLDVRERETAASLFYRVAHTHFTAGHELAGDLASRAVAARVQDESAATRWPRRRPRDGEISAAMTRAEIDALVRALLGPYPRAFVVIDGQPRSVRGLEFPCPAGRAGEGAEASGERIRFACADGEVDLLTADRSA